MKLYAHQQELLDRNPAKHLICFGTGLGKTLTSIELSFKNRCNSTLVICPKSLKEKWNRDIENMRLTRTNETNSRSWKVMSKEEFRRDWERLERYDALIVDEAHYFSGITSQMSKNLTKYIKKWGIQYIWLLTATPYMSTPWNIYTLARHLGKEWSYMGFQEKFFTHRYVGQRLVPVVKAGIEDEIAQLVKSIGTTAKMEDCFDVPEQIFETEYISITKDQEKKIKELETVETNPIVRFTKVHQVENGTLKGDGYSPDVVLDSLKNERIIDLIETNDKVAIFCRYNLQIDALHKLISETIKDKNIYVIRGDTKNRDEVVQSVEREPKCVVIINASCSEGYELPSVGVCVFASLSFSYKDYEQGCGRFLRANKLKKNVYIHLVTSGGIDESVYKSIMKKQDFSIAIYAEER